MPKTLPKPRERPGTDLHPLDRDPGRAPTRPPDKYGTCAGYAYQAWHIDGYQKVWIWRLSDGKRVDGSEVRSYSGRERVRVTPYHRLPADLDIERKLVRMHVRHMESEPSIPVTLTHCTELDDIMREKRVGPWKDEIPERDIETEQADGRTMHRLK